MIDNLLAGLGQLLQSMTFYLDLHLNAEVPKIECQRCGLSELYEPSLHISTKTTIKIFPVLHSTNFYLIDPQSGNKKQQIAVLNYHWRRTNMCIMDRPSGPRPNREQDTWTLGLRRKILMKFYFLFISPQLDPKV